MSTEDLSEVPVGQRVTVRHLLPDGRPTDAVGHITSHDADAVTLRTRRGEVRVPYASVVVHRVVRPGPWRIAGFLRRARVAVVGIDCLLPAGEGEGLLQDHAGPAAMAQLLEELAGAGVPVIVLARDDRSVRLLTDLGLPQLVPSVLATAADDGRDGGWHAAVEARLGRAVSPPQVHFTDPRPARVEDARELGWQARTFTPPP